MSRSLTHHGPLRVAIVGSGPSGLYAAVELLKKNPGAQVEMFDRLPILGGLARFGVAPDHAVRRRVTAVYERLALASGRYRFHGNVEIGRHLSHQDLLAHHHAVVYSSGAASDRRLGIGGEDLKGSHAATEFVAWYNGHPDFRDRSFDLSTERAIVVGNGNVALDIARVLLLSTDKLRATDIADHALTVLASSKVREVVVLGRRGPAQAAFTAPELLELESLDDVDIVVEGSVGALARQVRPEHALRLQLIDEYARRGVLGRPKRLLLRFLTSPVEILGQERVEGLRVVSNSLAAQNDGVIVAKPMDSVGIIPAGLVFRSVGYRANAVADLPFDEARAVLPNELGRVVDPATRQPLTGTYVAGWLKRGPSGGIGANKVCSRQTVAALLEDAAAGRLAEPAELADRFDRLLESRQSALIDYRAWKRIDRYERNQGAATGRTRVNLSRMEDLLRIAR